MFHGGLGSGSMLHPYLAEYTETRKVILIDHTPKPTQRASEICIQVSDSLHCSITPAGSQRADCEWVAGSDL